MKLHIRCEDLGFDCRHVLRGDTEEEVLDALMRHIAKDHESDWFDLEVVYDAARDSMHRVAA